MKFLQQITSWGITDDMPELTQKSIYLMNWLGIVGMIVIIPIEVMFISLHKADNIWFLITMQGLIIIIFLCNKYYYHRTAHFLLGFFGVWLLIMSVVTKLQGTTNSLTFVFPPRTAMMFAGLLPWIIYNQKYPWMRWLSTLPSFLSIVFFEEVHHWFGISVYDLPIGEETEVFQVSYTLVFINIATVIFTIQNVNKKFEEKVQNLYRITEEKNEELSAQNDIISLKNKHINDSINYASRIQDAIIPTSKQLQKIIPDSFVFFQPRDTVSGDFYQFYDLSDKVLIGAIDCTGHGVPGAFMSMIGSSILNQIVIEKNITDTDLILKQMHLMTRNLLKQEENQNRDGMDASLVSLHKIDDKFKLFEFSGAKNPLFFVQNSEMKIIKGDKFSIGGYQREAERFFKKHTLQIHTETMFYIFSDGYQDQFGGIQKRKFMTRNFRNLLAEISTKSAVEQHQILETTLLEWMRIGQEKQNDDILIIGFRI